LIHPVQHRSLELVVESEASGRRIGDGSLARRAAVVEQDDLRWCPDGLPRGEVGASDPAEPHVLAERHVRKLRVGVLLAREEGEIGRPKRLQAARLQLAARREAVALWIERLEMEHAQQTLRHLAQRAEQRADRVASLSPAGYGNALAVARPIQDVGEEEAN